MGNRGKIQEHTGKGMSDRTCRQDKSERMSNDRGEGHYGTGNLENTYTGRTRERRFRGFSENVPLWVSWFVFRILFPQSHLFLARHHRVHEVAVENIDLIA